MVCQATVVANIETTQPTGSGILQQAQGELGFARPGCGLYADDARRGRDPGYPSRQPIGQAQGRVTDLGTQGT